jgi:hypothetical protein
MSKLSFGITTLTNRTITAEPSSGFLLNQALSSPKAKWTMDQQKKKQKPQRRSERPVYSSN